MVLNQHALTDFNIPDLTMTNATKIRKCWHQDYPESKDIIPPGAKRGDDESQIMPNGARYDPCQDGTDFSGFEGYAGYKPGPGTGRGAAARGRGSAGGRTAPSSSAGGRGGYPMSASPMSERPIQPMQPKAPQRPQAVTVHLEEMRAALDCVAERANLNRQDIYVWIKDVISDDVWKPLWDSFTTDLMRQSQGAPPSSRAPPPGPARGPDYPPSPTRGPDYASQRLSGKGGPPVPDYASRGPPPQEYSNPRYDRQDYAPQDDELSALPELQSRLNRHRPPQQNDMDYFDDSVSCAPSHKSEAETMVSNAMSAWLQQEATAGAKLTPFELANWLRTLPKERLDGDMLKAVARHVLDNEVDETQFEKAVAAQKLGAMGAEDPRQQRILERYFKQRQTEAVMAETAKVTGALNNQLRAQCDAAWSSRRVDC